MKVLIACECSGVVRAAFRARGHDAWSCDLLPAEDGDPHHFHSNVISHDIIKQQWDMLIAFPDCTFLTVAGARWMSVPWRAAAQQWALAFVKTLWALPIEKKALENPISRLSTLWKKPDQIIHPWQHGHKEMKSTCLWLEELPPLTPTDIVGPPPDDPEERKSWAKVHRMPPGPNRAKDRSRFLAGPAQAMAEQWG